MDSPRVLWVDEDQAELGAVEWIIARCGATVERALSVEEACACLKRSRPDAILLDLIVRVGHGATSADRYTGLTVWDALTEEQKSRTIVISIVRKEDVLRVLNIDPNRVFGRLTLKDRLGELERTLKGLLLAAGEDA